MLNLEDSDDRISLGNPCKLLYDNRKSPLANMRVKDCLTAHFVI